MKNPISVTTLLILAALSLQACVAHKSYNVQFEEYQQEITVQDTPGVSYDLAIIEFDDQGVFWDIEQLQSCLDLITRRNAESERGILVIPYIHGWKNDANPQRGNGDLQRFTDELSRIATQTAAEGILAPDRVVGVYLGWRGASSRAPLFEQLTFWNRRQAAERLSSFSMRETIFSIAQTTKSRPESKCYVVGHSMGGLVVGRTLAPSLATLLLAETDEGAEIPVDLILMLNPALDAMSSWQFIDLLKRRNAKLQLRQTNGERLDAPGPMFVSITSESDRATGSAYPFGRTISNLFTLYREDFREGVPSQRHLATHAEGHVDFLISHRAWVNDGEIMLERVPNAYNDTPFWIVQVSSDISRNHSDTSNPRIRELTDRITSLNQLFEPGVELRLVSPLRE